VIDFLARASHKGKKKAAAKINVFGEQIKHDVAASVCVQRWSELVTQVPAFKFPQG
jgi:hypothetical protein